MRKGGYSRLGVFGTMNHYDNSGYKIGESKSVLIVSHSNVSVDGVIKQVVKMLGTDKQSVLEDGKILRFGYVRDDELSQNPYATSFNYALSKCDSYAQKESLNEKEESFVNK